MAGATLQGFGEVEIRTVVLRLLLFALYHLGGNLGGEFETTAQGIAHTLVLVHAFGQNVPCTLQGICHRGNLLRDVCLGILLGVAIGSVQNTVRQGFKTTLACHLGTSLALGFVGQVYVFQHGGIPAGGYPFLQFVCKFALLLDGLQDILLAVLQFLELLALTRHLGYLHFVQATRGLLSVACYEGYGGTSIQQAECLFYLALAYAKSLGYDVYYLFHTYILVVRLFSFMYAVMISSRSLPYFSTEALPMYGILSRDLGLSGRKCTMPMSAFCWSTQ